MPKLLIVTLGLIIGGCASNQCIDESKKDPDAMCMQVYEPVCGCNDQTYSNACEARKAGVTEFTDGGCD